MSRDAPHDTATDRQTPQTTAAPPAEAAATGTAARLPAPVPIAQQSWPEGTVPLVSICCATYNHGAFVRQCLDGFLTQETTFPVEILIHDDASTDDTATVIREYAAHYPSLIKPILQEENQYSKGIKPNVHFNYPRVKGRYIAFCEGDDYWTSPQKLMMQVSFLETHANYSLCWTRFVTLENTTGVRKIDGNGRYFAESGGCGFSFAEFVEGWHIGTQTLVFRRAAMNQANLANPAFRDVFLISDLLTWGPGYCLPEVMATYRIHAGGIHSSKTELERAAIGVGVYRAIYLAHRDNHFLRAKYENIATAYVTLLFDAGEYGKAIAAGAEFVALAGRAGDEDAVPKVFAGLVRKLRRKDRQFARSQKEVRELHASTALRAGRMLTWPARAGRALAAMALRSVPGPSSVSGRTPAIAREHRVPYVDKRQIERESRQLQPMAAPAPPRTPRLIVSLTSYPPRMHDTFYALVSLLRQSTAPDLLVLWLASSQFPRRERDVSKRILRLMELGLTIRWCEDLKSYKKLVPALREFPDDVIVTADDDIYYASDWLERLHRSFLADPRSIHAHRAHRVAMSSQAQVSSYDQWPKCIAASEPAYANFFTGAGGVLYPPGSLAADVTDEKLFMRLCPTADDIWFWAMAVLKGTKVRVVESNDREVGFLNEEERAGLMARGSLWAINRHQNDEQLQAVASFCELERGVSLSQRLEHDGA